MAALRRDPGRLETRRPAADHQHGLHRRRRLEPIAVPLELAPGRRVHEARDPVVARPAAPAQLVARDARPHLVGAVGAGLGDQVRVGDLAADDADHVGLPGGKDGLGGLGRPDVALGLDAARASTTRLSSAANGTPSCCSIQRDRDDRVEVEVRARAAGHVVHRLPLRRARRRSRRAPPSTGSGAERSSIETARPMMKSSPHAARIRSRIVAEKRIRPSNEPPQRVVAAVRPRRPELVDERVVGREDLDPVEAGVLRAARARDEPLDDLLDLGLGHRVAAVGVVVRRQARRRPVRRERVVGVAVLADVVQLLDHHDVRVRVAAGVGQSAEARARRRRRRGGSCPASGPRSGGPAPAPRRSSRRRRAPAPGSSRCADRRAARPRPCSRCGPRS